MDQKPHRRGYPGTVRTVKGCAYRSPALAAPADEIHAHDAFKPKKQGNFSLQILQEIKIHHTKTLEFILMGEDESFKLRTSDFFLSFYGEIVSSTLNSLYKNFFRRVSAMILLKCKNQTVKDQLNDSHRLKDHDIIRLNP